MSQDDSNSLLDGPQASKLGPNRAYFSDEERIGKLEKFRPYKLVSGEQIREMGIQLRGRHDSYRQVQRTLEVQRTSPRDKA